MSDKAQPPGRRRHIQKPPTMILFFLFSFPVTCSICSMFPETEGFIETPSGGGETPSRPFGFPGASTSRFMQHVRLGVGLSCAWAAVFPVPLPCVVARNWKNRTPQQCKSDDPAPTQQGMLGQIEESNDRTNCLKSKPRQGVGVIRGLRPHDSMLRHDVGPAQMTSKRCPLITRRKRGPVGNVITPLVIPIRHKWRLSFCLAVPTSDPHHAEVEAFIWFCNTHQPNTNYDSGG